MLHRHLQLAERSRLLGSLSSSVRACVLSKARVRNFPRGATIFIQGEQARNLNIVLEGRVKLYRVAPSGCEAIVEVCAPGRSFEELATLRGEAHRVSAQAATDASLLFVDLAGIDACPSAHQELMQAALAAAAESLDMLLDEVEQLKVQNGAQRLSGFLLSFCDGGEGRCEFELPYEKHLIAGRLGMKPESLSRAIRRLRRQGVAIRSDRVTIEDAGSLRRFLSEDRAMAWIAA